VRRNTPPEPQGDTRARGQGLRVLFECLSLGLCLGCAREGDGRALPELRGSVPAELRQTSAGSAAAAPAGGDERSVAVAAGSYPLDALSRVVPRGGLECPAVDAREFTGQHVAFTPAAKVIDAFRARLGVLEQIVQVQSRLFYGRSPSRILVAASYDCRPVSGSGRISEHAFANAIDITGFQFAEAPILAPDGSVRAVAIPGSFEVRVDRHWHAHGDAVLERHARFLAALTDELIRREVFRTLLGPAHPDHADHFHFDMAPGKYVDL